MKQIQLALLVMLLLMVGGSTVACQSSVIDSIAESHIDGNVPDEKDFDKFLKRDLAAYFKESTGKDVVVEYELLRNAPTQSGIAFPKFYAWVKVKEKDNLIEEGAVRLAAMEKKRFGVTDYLKRSDIEKDVEQVYKVFPRPVGDKIKERISKSVSLNGGLINGREGETATVLKTSFVKLRVACRRSCPRHLSR